nr:MAG TPA: hypothetical protein [Caudoviricetes sp.]
MSSNLYRISKHREEEQEDAREAHYLEVAGSNPAFATN